MGKEMQDMTDKMFVQPPTARDFVPLAERTIPDDPLAIAKLLRETIGESVPGQYALQLATRLVELLE